jgi:hypothetical protein
MLDLIAIKTPDGAMISTLVMQTEYSGGWTHTAYLFDGAVAEPTYDRLWLKISAIPTIVQRIIPATRETRCYRLKPEFGETELTPREVPPEFFWDSETCDSCNDGYRALYDAEYDETPEQYESIEFTVNVLATVDDFDGLKSFEFLVNNRAFGAVNPTLKINEGSAQHQILDKILFPKRLLAARPCKLTVRDSYEVIRKHIKDNIDPRHAILTDYDFILHVDKRIRLPEREAYQVDVSGLRAKKPKLETRYRSHRSTRVYEIAPDGYHNAPPPPVFEGGNYRELEKNIKVYLDTLMAEINEPLVGCPHCKGTGVLIEPCAATTKKQE